MPLTDAPAAEGGTVHWSKTMPPIETFVTRLSAVIDVLGVFGEIVEAKK
jgi:hypothetical protein